MFTTLKHNDVFRLKRRGQWHYYVVHELSEECRLNRFKSLHRWDHPEEKSYGAVRYTDIPKDTIIHSCVFKESGRRLVSRFFVIKKQDATTKPVPSFLEVL